jgi:hypothetical protein
MKEAHGFRFNIRGASLHKHQWFDITGKTGGRKQSPGFCGGNLVVEA